MSAMTVATATHTTSHVLCVYCENRFMDAVPHFRLCEREHLGNLRPGDAFMTTGQVTQREWHQPHNYSAVALQRNLNK